MIEAVKKNGVNFGIIVGVIAILIAAMIYAIDVTSFSEWWIGLIMLTINITIGCIAVSKARKSLGGFISFKDAFTTFFITMAIGTLIYFLFSYVLMNFIDPAAAEAVTEATIEKTVSWMQSMGTPTEQIKEFVEEMRKADNFGIWGQTKALLGSLLMYCIIGLIVSAIMKKNKPEFE